MCEPVGGEAFEGDSTRAIISPSSLQKKVEVKLVGLKVEMKIIDVPTHVMILMVEMIVCFGSDSVIRMLCTLVMFMWFDLVYVNLTMFTLDVFMFV